LVRNSNLFWTPDKEKTKIFSLLLDFCQNLHSTRYWRFWHESYARFLVYEDLNSELLRFWYPHYGKLYKRLKFFTVFMSGAVEQWLRLSIEVGVTWHQIPGFEDSWLNRTHERRDPVALLHSCWHFVRNCRIFFK
jgi:hypothetical protein